MFTLSWDWINVNLSFSLSSTPLPRIKSIPREDKGQSRRLMKNRRGKVKVKKVEGKAERRGLGGRKNV